jgi:hypothetical protein
MGAASIIGLTLTAFYIVAIVGLCIWGVRLCRKDPPDA